MIGNTTIITITEAAVGHIKNMLEKDQKNIGFRLSIKKTGCSGYAYVPDIISEIKQNDIYFMQQDLPVYVDPDCEQFVSGLVIDYVADNNIGLKQKRLVFINPNEKNRCGCGESFTVD